ncbi:hypothetical protein EV586_102224 [Tumebacillus sp. BK434]|uniref:hypothetical protein n=1 Tax=Tumebacillus sp. BK434 TaxID=2512169 RepID=UPI0010DC1787|nr:hypothetical protein [Tumebacillus sp. BK434]TCP57780.1 hypothetical protein EV586_102224 [Tumebacillus sp. BK434]
MTILTFRTSTYARNIYIYGTTKFSDIPAEYVQPVKDYAEANFSREQLEHAQEMGYLS